MRLRPRIRTILLGVNVIILMLPVAGIAFLRIYDNELVRRTEAELVAQGTTIAAAYRQQIVGVFERNAVKTSDQDGIERVGPEGYGMPREFVWPSTWDDTEGRFPPTLDVTGRIHPVAPRAAKPAESRDPIAEIVHDDGGGQQLLQEAHSVNGVDATIVDWRGTVMSASGSTSGRSIGNREEVRRALSGEVVTMLREAKEGGDVAGWETLTRRVRLEVVVAVPVVYQDRVWGAVVLSKAPMSLATAVYQNRAVFAGLLAVLIIGVSMITLLTTFTIQRPIRQLNRQTKRIAMTGGATRAIQNPGAREFEELSDAIAAMAQTLEERNEYIRTFARNVSHEFKTPLASIQGTIELLEDHYETMAPEKRSEFLGMIGKDTERLDRLVRRLLELARADVFNPTTEWTDASKLLPELADRAKIDLTLDLNGADLAVAMSPDAFESVFANLFENSAKHGGTNVKVEVVDRSGGYHRIFVADDGPGISEANAEKIFESFFTTARDQGGTGLGLPIVKSLLERHGGDIKLVPTESGAAFLVTVPRSA